VRGLALLWLPGRRWLLGVRLILVRLPNLRLAVRLAVRLARLRLLSLRLIDQRWLASRRRLGGLERLATPWWLSGV
jgi:hypothetical protein